MSKVSKTLVAAYSIRGKLIKTYPSAAKAAKVRHVYKRTIDRATRGDILTVKNLQWRRVDVDNIPTSIEPLKRVKATNSKKKVAKLDESGNIIEVYESLSLAAKTNNIDPHTLRDRISGKYTCKNKAKFIFIDQ